MYRDVDVLSLMNENEELLKRNEQLEESNQELQSKYKRKKLLAEDLTKYFNERNKIPDTTEKPSKTPEIVVSTALVIGLLVVLIVALAEIISSPSVSQEPRLNNIKIAGTFCLSNSDCKEGYCYSEKLGCIVTTN